MSRKARSTQTAWRRGLCERKSRAVLPFSRIRNMSASLQGFLEIAFWDWIAELSKPNPGERQGLKCVWCAPSSKLANVGILPVVGMPALE
jgi:hypothetical protein